MAGIGLSAHPVEKEGIKKGKKLAEKADGILLLLDSSRKETSEDLKLLHAFSAKKMLLLFNKIDLPQKINKEKVMTRAQKAPCLEISALKRINLEKLKKKMASFFLPSLKDEENIILHLRQKLLLENIRDLLAEGKRLLDEGYPEEIYAEEIKKTLPLIGQITGEIRSDEVINEIFSRFCVGK